MTTATDHHQQPPKRTRFEDPPATAAPSESAKPPKSLAESFIKASIASLHPQISTIVEKLGKEHILLLSKKEHLIQVHQRMIDNEDFIPRSARIQFDLKGSNRAVELAEYKQLAEETSLLVIEFTKTLKTKIRKAAALEISAATNELRYHLAKCLRIITSAYMFKNNDTSNIDSKVHSVISDYLDHLSVNAKINVATFGKIYKEVHSIDNFPPSTTAAPTNATVATRRTEATTAAEDHSRLF